MSVVYIKLWQNKHHTMTEILHISDSSLSLSFPVLSDTPAILFEKVKEKHANSILFLINVNYKTDNISRADNAGILFLKYLRLNHFNQHSILYSFLSREQLMDQDPYNSIIFSQGVTFIRMPENLNKVDFESIAKKKAPDNLSSFFKAEFRLPDDRHFFANWWGVLQLWKVQKAVERIAGKTVITDVETGFAGSINEMNSYDGLVARYVKSIHDTDIEKTLRTFISARKENSKNGNQNRSRIQDEIDNLLAEDAVIEIQLSALEEIDKEEKNNFLSKLIAFFSDLPTTVQQKINQLNEKRASIKENISASQEYLELIDSINKVKDHIYNERRKLNRQIQSKIDKLISCNSFLTEDYSLDTIRQKLAEKKPTILFVDDQAEDGWATILQRMIYDGNSDNFIVIQPGKNDSIGSVVSKIEETVRARRIDLLMLDLRLKGETGGNFNIDEISGIQVLKQLPAIQLPCPVIITSASNKIWSYRETLKLNADAYWIKEGLDDNYNLETSIENYLRLLDLVYALFFNEEYRFLYDKLVPAVLTIKNSTSPFWWESKFWEKNSYSFKRSESTISVRKSKPVAKEEIIDTLIAGTDLFKKYLSEKIQKSETIHISRYVGSLVIIQFCRVLEIIHRFDESNDRFSLSEKMQSQLDDQTFNYFSKLITIRNSATHNFSANFNAITNFIEPFMSYLTSNILEIPCDELMKHESQDSEPIDGATYFTIIAGLKRGTQIFFLKNPNLKLSAGRPSILLHLNNIISVPKPSHDEMGILIGKSIEFELIISLNSAGQVNNYYAKNAKIID